MYIYVTKCQVGYISSFTCICSLIINKMISKCDCGILSLCHFVDYVLWDIVLWDFVCGHYVLWDFVVWDFVCGHYVLWDFVLWDSDLDSYCTVQILLDRLCRGLSECDFFLRVTSHSKLPGYGHVNCSKITLNYI